MTACMAIQVCISVSVDDCILSQSLKQCVTVLLYLCIRQCG